MKYPIIILTLLFAALQIAARDNNPAVNVDSWEVNVRQMPADTRNEITRTMEQLNGSAQDRGILADIGTTLGIGVVGGLVDAVVTETFNLINYRKKQKAEWMKMIMNENSYTDSISSIRGIRDFYASNSRFGALDPSDINFDGIEIRGIRNGNEVIYLSCSIDRNNLEHLFRHSKFTLVIDSMAFYPYNCHLPNLTANGIKTISDLRHGCAAIKGDSIVRPGTGGNGFSFDERNDLRVKISFSIFSSWINQAIQIHKDVELGNFTFDIAIPDNVRLFSYSRKAIIDRAQKLPENERESFLNSHLLRVEGDSFVVPRSYMPLSNGRPMWGTGEYTIKVKVSESCRFADNSDKARHWREDYKRLRQMQQRSGEVEEYFTTLWNQYGTQLVKSSYSSTLKTALTDLTGLPLTTVASPAKSRPSSAPGQKK
jgi:hypothetical protein